jgi:hypothetical protein
MELEVRYKIQLTERHCFTLKREIDRQGITEATSNKNLPVRKSSND